MKKILVFCMFFFSVSLYAEEVIFQDFENPGEFKINKAEKAKIEIQSVPGYEGNAILINYDLTKDHFVEIYKDASIDLTDIESFSWYARGTANGNIIEIKFVDNDGTTFGTKYPISGLSEGSWKKFTLNMRQLHYMWDGDSKVDTVKRFYIAISRGGLAKTGMIIIDQFSYDMKKKGIPSTEIQLNQVGYHPADKKFFIVRVYDVNADADISGNFIIKNKFDNKNILSGKLTDTGFSDWKGKFLKGEFSSLAETGDYFIQVALKTPEDSFSKNSYPFSVKQNIYTTTTIPLELEYLQYQRCGIRCHKHDPVMGGYHDTLFDISKRMWSIPGLIYGMALYARDSQEHPDKNNDKINDDWDELLWGFKFIEDLPDADGTIPWGGIEADFKKFMTYDQFINRIGALKPEDDELPKIRYTEKNFCATAFNLIALINSIPTVKQMNPELIEKAETVIDHAWQWMNKQKLTDAKDYGFYLWSAAELYNYYKDKKYLAKAEEYLPKLLDLQVLNYNKFENNTCGDFYTSARQKDFRNQYKYVYLNFAINMALIEFCRILPVENPLWFDVYYANRVYGENYLKGLASKTPYKQMAVGLELANPSKKDISRDSQWLAEADADNSCSYYNLKENNEYYANMNYSFNKGNWVTISKNIDYNLTDLSAVNITFRYKGKQNNLEIKLIDQDNTVYVYQKTISAVATWQTLTAAFTDFKYLSGKNQSLDLKYMNKISIGSIKVKGGSGDFDIKDLEFVKNDQEIVKVPGPVIDNSILFKLNYFAGPEAKEVAADNHGLNCDHLARAFIALKWGSYISDLELEEFADNQLNWVLGTNPLDYCMVLGAGVNNPVIMAEYYDKPRLPGLIPNGIVGEEKKEPTWRGDVPCSGEDWMPHNSAYFTLLSIIDSPGDITGKILNKGKPVINAIVSIMDKGRKSFMQTHTDKTGYYELLKIEPQKEYTLTVKQGNISVSKEIKVLSGMKKDLNIDLSRNYSIEIIEPPVIKVSEVNTFIIKVSKTALKMPYRIRVKGAKIKEALDGRITAAIIKLTVIPDGNKPVLLRFEIPGEPLISEEKYYRSL